MQVRVSIVSGAHSVCMRVCVVFLTVGCGDHHTGQSCRLDHVALSCLCGSWKGLTRVATLLG